MNVHISIYLEIKDREVGDLEYNSCDFNYDGNSAKLSDEESEDEEINRRNMEGEIEDYLGTLEPYCSHFHEENQLSSVDFMINDKVRQKIEKIASDYDYECDIEVEWESITD